MTGILDNPHQTLTRLTRLARRRSQASEWLMAAFQRDLEGLAPVALDVALETGDPVGKILANQLGPNATEALAERLMRRCNGLGPPMPTTWREVAFESTRKCLAARGAAMGPEAAEEERADVARIAANLSNRCHELGRWEDALRVSHKAIEILRQLATDRPDVYISDLAKSLSNACIRYAILGRWQEALAAICEAVEIQRLQAAESTDAPRLDLASSLDNLGIILSELHRPEEAFEANREAVEIRRDHLREYPHTLPLLAGSLANLAGRLKDLGRETEALETIRESVEIRRKLAADQPNTFLPDLARSLFNSGIVLGGLEYHEEACKVARESVDIRRSLVRERPEAFLPDLARSLNSLGLRLYAFDHRQEALEVIREAISVRRQLETAHPGALRYDLAKSLHDLGIVLSALDREEEARVSFIEAIDIRQQIAQQRPPVVLPELVESFDQLIASLHRLGRRDEALKMAKRRESISLKADAIPGETASQAPKQLRVVNSDDFAVSTLGETAPQAHRHLRVAASDDSMWFNYSQYADPGSFVTFSDWTPESVEAALGEQNISEGEKAMLGSTKHGNTARALKVFLCHAIEDKPKVRDLYRQLHAHGIDAWLDEEEILPGQDWEFKINEALRSCHVVLICISGLAAQKEGFFQKELSRALDIAAEKPEGAIYVIPARFDKCDIPSRLRRWQAVNIFDDNGFARLMKTLRHREKELNLRVSRKSPPRGDMANR